MRIAVGPRMLAAAGRHPPAGPEHADSPCRGPHRPRATRSRGAGGYRDHCGRARLPRPSLAKPRLRLPERHTLSCLSAGSLGGRSLCTAHDRTWDEHVVTAWAPAAPGTPGPARTGRLSAGDTAFRAAGPAPQAARAPWHRPHSLFPEGPAFRSGHTHCPLLAQAPGPRSCSTRNPGSRGPCGPTVGPALLPPAGLPCSLSPVPPRAAPAPFVSCL